MMMIYVSTICTTIWSGFTKCTTVMKCLSTTHTPTFNYIRSTSSVTSDLWEIGLDNIQHNDGIVKQGRSTQSVITNLWEGDCNLWLAPTQQQPHNSDPAVFVNTVIVLSLHNSGTAIVTLQDLTTRTVMVLQPHNSSLTIVALRDLKQQWCQRLIKSFPRQCKDL